LDPGQAAPGPLVVGILHRRRAGRSGVGREQQEPVLQFGIEQQLQVLRQPLLLIWQIFFAVFVFLVEDAFPLFLFHAAGRQYFAECGFAVQVQRIAQLLFEHRRLL